MRKENETFLDYLKDALCTVAVIFLCWVIIFMIYSVGESL
jgi:hypothetical protein